RGSTRLNSSLLTCWIHGSMLLSPYQYMSIQTRQLVSSHQQFNGGVGGPRRGVKLYTSSVKLYSCILVDCAVQSTTIHEWDIGSESPYQ
ncbi:hypothetical protein AVEN_82499-1, partial [Araneus ventricosus]